MTTMFQVCEQDDSYGAPKAILATLVTNRTDRIAQAPVVDSYGSPAAAPVRAAYL